MTNRFPRVACRQGSTVIIVLGLVAVTLALSYAVLRTQVTTVRIQENVSSQISAEQAATTGLSVGLNAMHQTGWTGVDTTLARQLGPHERFEVAYATGDPSLTAADPQYSDLPYRVTLTAKGFVLDPTTQREVSATAQAVVRLVPRQLGTEPTGWQQMVGNYTLYQWGTSGGQDKCNIELPFRVEGLTRLQGRVTLCDTNPPRDTYRERYLRDLNQMRTSGYGDHRPFNGPLELNYANAATDQRSLLTSQLGVSVSSATVTTPASWTPAARLAYRIYPGGKSYSIATIGQTVGATTLGPNVVSNPLGIFHGSTVQLNSNAVFQGTLLATGDVNLGGTSIQIKPVSSPALYGTSQPVQLPVVVAQGDFQLLAAGGGAVEGMVITQDDFETEKGSQNLGLTIRGRMLAREIKLSERQQWDLLTTIWDDLWLLFNLQLINPIEHFPRWLDVFGLKYVPLLTIKPESTPVRYYFPQSIEPMVVYAPHPDDGGLRWEVLNWIGGGPQTLASAAGANTP